MVKKVMFLVIACCSVSLLTTAMVTAEPAQKPLPPLQVTIQPVRTDITPDAIQPGEAIAFRVTAVSLVDTQEMRIKVDLVSGAELVSGGTSWIGRAAKNVEKVLILTVRAPKNGRGSIKARASIPNTQGAAFSTETSYQLGADAQASQKLNQKSSIMEPEQQVKKDSKGTSVIEYR